MIVPHNEIGSDPEEIKRYLAGVEAIGATHLLVYDHILGVDREHHRSFEGTYDADSQFHEPLTFLAFAAAVTRTVELVTSVIVPPLRQTSLLAKQVAEVAILSGGRLRLGVGVGWNEIEYVAVGASFGDRGDRLEEQVALMRALLASSTVEFEGRFDKVVGLSLNPRPAASVPIWFGGSSPAAARRCARLGQGWIARDSPRRSEDLIRIIREARAELGLPSAGFGLQAQAQYSGGTPGKWRDHAASWSELGATHIAVGTQGASAGGVDGHLERFQEYYDALQP